jgi:hypothetical protein
VQAQASAQRIPVTWIDSLQAASSELSTQLAAARATIVADNWSELADRAVPLARAAGRATRAHSALDRLLDVGYAYNYDSTLTELEGVYRDARGQGTAADIAAGLSRAVIALGSFAEPTGAQKDTLLQVVDETKRRCDALGPAYRQILEQYDEWGFRIPPVVSLLDYSVSAEDPGERTLQVQCQVANVSSVPVGALIASLRDATNSGFTITAKTDTTVAGLAAGAQATFAWDVEYAGNARFLLFDLSVRSAMTPPEFEGDQKTICQMIPGVAPLTHGTLDDDNLYAYPNPFNPEKESCKLVFRLARPGRVTLRMYDSGNRLVATIMSGQAMSAGQQIEIPWDGRNDHHDLVANGVYFYVIESTSGERGVGKLAVLR